MVILYLQQLRAGSFSRKEEMKKINDKEGNK